MVSSGYGEVVTEELLECQERMRMSAKNDFQAD